MANVDTGTLSRSEIEAVETAHLDAAATQWNSEAGAWESHFETIHRGTLSPGGTQWEGSGADAAQDGTFADLVKVRGITDHLRGAAAAARNGADDIAWAKGQALNAITEAEQSGFAVGENLSVSDRSMIPLLSTAQAARQAQAEAFGAEIRAAAENLAAVDKTVAAQVTTALAPLGETSFGDTGTAPTVQAVDYKTAPPPPDPGGDERNPGDPHPDYPNRTNDGKYGDGNSRDGKAAEKAALDQREQDLGIPIVRDQVRATHPGVINPKTGKPQGRFYDGLQPTGIPGEYIGVEAKTDEGVSLPGDQARFDAAVSPQSPATAILDGQPIKIVDTAAAYPPSGWVPQPTTVPGTASGAPPGLPPPPVMHQTNGAPLLPAPGNGPLPNWGTHLTPDEAAQSGGEIGNLGKVLEQYLPPNPTDPDNTA